MVRCECARENGMLYDKPLLCSNVSLRRGRRKVLNRATWRNSPAHGTVWRSGNGFCEGDRYPDR
jgi:hypothetical protein